jgi:hypothetical protein
VQSEKDVQTDIIKAVKAANGYVTKVMRANTSGVPDLIIALDGVFVGCEVKAGRHIKDPEKQMSPWQHKHKKMIQESNSLFCCVASLEQFKDYLADNLIYL